MADSTLSELASEYGIKRRTLGMRLLNYGWNINKALNK